MKATCAGKQLSRFGTGIQIIQRTACRRKPVEQKQQYDARSGGGEKNCAGENYAREPRRRQTVLNARGGATAVVNVIASSCNYLFTFFFFEVLEVEGRATN